MTRQSEINRRNKAPQPSWVKRSWTHLEIPGRSQAPQQCENDEARHLAPLRDAEPAPSWGAFELGTPIGYLWGYLGTTRSKGRRCYHQKHELKQTRAAAAANAASAPLQTESRTRTRRSGSPRGSQVRTVLFPGWKGLGSPVR